MADYTMWIVLLILAVLVGVTLSSCLRRRQERFARRARRKGSITTGTVASALVDADKKVAKVAYRYEVRGRDYVLTTEFKDTGCFDALPEYVEVAYDPKNPMKAVAVIKQDKALA